MIKKYYSKYTGKQIDEAVAALIENNVRIEDLNEEVVELINSKADEEDLAALKEEVNNEFKVALEDLVGSASEPIAIPTSGMIETVYVKNLPRNNLFEVTDEKFIEVCKQLKFNIGSTCTYTVFQTNSVSAFISGNWNSNTQEVEHFAFAIPNANENTETTDTQFIVPVNEEIIRAGTQNELLKDFFSLTSFDGNKGRVGELEAAVEEINTNLDTKVELVEMPQSLVVKLLTAFNSGGANFELTDNELAIFENFENKKYLAISPENSAISVVFTPAYKGILDDGKSLILYSGEMFMLQINLVDKIGRADNTILSHDIDYFYDEIEKINTNLDTKVETVNVPQDLVLKLLGTLVTQEYVSLTNEEMALFDNAKNKEYYVEVPDEKQSKLIYRYKLIMSVANIDYLILESVANALWVNLTDKLAAVTDTQEQIADNDIKHLIQMNSDEIAKKVDQTYVDEQLGDIGEVLDEINGSGTISDGSSATIKSLSIEFNFLDENEWQYDAENYKMTCLSDQKSTEITNFINTIGPKNPINFHIFPYFEEGDLYPGFTSNACTFQCFCGYSDEGIPVISYIGMAIMVVDIPVSIYAAILDEAASVSSQALSEFVGRKMILTAYYID